MINIGLISAATYGPSFRGREVERTPGSHHGTAFSSAFNGYDQAKVGQWQWTFAAAPRQLDAGRIVKVWDPHIEWAEKLADACRIEEVCRTPEQCCSGVDAVIIVDDGSGEHSKYAVYPLKQGVPTFCDKPLAMTAKRAADIGSLARETGTPFMSASSLRFVPDVIALKREFEAGALGDVHLVTTACGNELVYYGIHALSMYAGVFGGGAVSCVNVGRPDRNIVRVRYECGRDLVIIVAESDYMRAGYNINIYGTSAWRIVQPNLDGLYLYLLEKFVELVQTGEESVPVEDEIEVIAILEAGKRSIEEGREIAIAEVLA